MTKLRFRWRHPLLLVLIGFFVIWGLFRPQFNAVECGYSEYTNASGAEGYVLFGLFKNVQWLRWITSDTISFHPSDIHLSGLLIPSGVRYSQLDHVAYRTISSSQHGLLRVYWTDGTQRDFGWADNSCLKELRRVQFKLDLTFDLTSLPDEEDVFRREELDNIWELIF